MTRLNNILKGTNMNKEPAISFQASQIEFRMMSLGMGKIRDTVWSFRHDSQIGLKASHRQGDPVSKLGLSFCLLLLYLESFHPFSSLALRLLPRMQLLRVHRSNHKQPA